MLHPERDSRAAMSTIGTWVRGHQATLIGLPEEVDRTDGAVPVPAEKLADQSDLVVSLGGDGTMLRSMRLACGGKAPVLGVNLGRLGFLAEIDVPQLPEALSAIDDKRFTVEPRSAVRSIFHNQEQLAFNEVALVRRPGGPMAAVALFVEGHPFIHYVADALIVATPTGSTAYSFSAGGPIVSPRAQGLVVTPVAPHSAYNRALVLSEGEKVALRVLPASGDLEVESDGAVVGRLCPGDVVEVCAVPGAANVVRLGHTTFYQRAQRKLRLTGSTEVDRSW
ncbi:NAD(+)/NADH kinase [Phytohabitans rumicis]|uniref:NAD(+)/NADH kinase n=1 Tax=Phytohabitans rumicis TaxID=1076125 RepID=UPI001C498D2D|nr:NAD(+)/NADH kinase [Phytohabitans rumicis]